MSGEQVVGLRSLSLPGADDPLDAVAASDSVRLFAERATAAKAGFRIDAANVQSVAEICRRLDGIPLALELAAARISSMSGRDRRSPRRALPPAAGWTAHRDGTPPDAPRRSRVVVLAALRDRGREGAVFDRLGVFAGTFDAAAAEAIATGGDVEDWDVLDVAVEPGGQVDARCRRRRRRQLALPDARNPSRVRPRAARRFGRVRHLATSPRAALREPGRGGVIRARWSARAATATWCRQCSPCAPLQRSTARAT